MMFWLLFTVLFLHQNILRSAALGNTSTPSNCSWGPSSTIHDSILQFTKTACQRVDVVDMKMLLHISVNCSKQEVMSPVTVSSPFSLLDEEVGAGTIPKKVMGVYYTNWAQYRAAGGTFTAQDFDASFVNVVNYGFAKLNRDLSVTYFDPTDIDGYYGNPDNLGAFTILRNKIRASNPLSKFLISLGGWNLSRGEGHKTGCRVCSPETKYYFPWAIGSANNRTLFATNLLRFVRMFQFDGLDIDWEYPTSWTSVTSPADKENFVLMMKTIRDVFDADTSKTGRPRLLLTAATTANHVFLPQAYDLKKLETIVDWLNVMTYDLYGPWDPIARPHTAFYPPLQNDASLFSVERAVNSYLSRGFPANKIILGLASYARCFYLDIRLPMNKTNLNAPAYYVIDPVTEKQIAPVGLYTNEFSMVAYYEVLLKLRQYRGTVIRDPVTRTTVAQWNERRPDGVMARAWCGYDTIDDLALKVNLVKQKRLRGAFFWAIDLDDFQSGFPLTRYVSARLK